MANDSSTVPECSESSVESGYELDTQGDGDVFEHGVDGVLEAVLLMGCGGEGTAQDKSRSRGLGWWGNHAVAARQTEQ